MESVLLRPKSSVFLFLFLFFTFYPFNYRALILKQKRQCLEYSAFIINFCENGLGCLRGVLFCLHKAVFQ